MAIGLRRTRLGRVTVGLACVAGALVGPSAAAGAGPCAGAELVSVQRGVDHRSAGGGGAAVSAGGGGGTGGRCLRGGSADLRDPEVLGERGLRGGVGRRWSGGGSAGGGRGAGHGCGGERVRDRCDAQPDREVRPERGADRRMGKRRCRVWGSSGSARGGGTRRGRAGGSGWRVLMSSWRTPTTIGSSGSAWTGATRSAGGRWGRGRGSSSTRRGSRRTGRRCSWPTMTTTGSRSSRRMGPSWAQVGSLGSGPGQFAYPYDVALDGAGDVYVADNNNGRVVEFNPQLGFLESLGAPGSDAGQMSFPRALAVSPGGAGLRRGRGQRADRRVRSGGRGRRVVRPLGQGAGRVHRAAERVRGAERGAGRGRHGRQPDGGVRSERWVRGGVGRGGSGPGEFSSPRAAVFDLSGGLEVADTGNHRTQHLTRSGAAFAEFGTSTSGAPAGLVGERQRGHDRGRQRGGRIEIFAPGSTTGQVVGGPGAGPGEFASPTAVATDRGGDIYVADTGNNRVEELASDGTFIRQWGRRGGTNGRFRDPDGIAVDGAGEVYVSDRTNNRIEKFTGEGVFVAAWGTRGAGPGEMIYPGGLTVDCRGSVIVAEPVNHRLQSFRGAGPATGCAQFVSFAAPPAPKPVVSVRLLHRTGILARRGIGLAISCSRTCRAAGSRAGHPGGRDGTDGAQRGVDRAAGWGGESVPPGDVEPGPGADAERAREEAPAGAAGGGRDVGEQRGGRRAGRERADDVRRRRTT